LTKETARFAALSGAAVLAAASVAAWTAAAALRQPSYPPPAQDPAAATAAATAPPEPPLPPSEGDLRACHAFAEAQEGRITVTQFGAAVAGLRVAQPLELPVIAWVAGRSPASQAAIAAECATAGVTGP
jgi:hypothetical protein